MLIRGSCAIVTLINAIGAFPDPRTRQGFRTCQQIRRHSNQYENNKTRPLETFTYLGLSSVCSLTFCTESPAVMCHVQ